MLHTTDGGANWTQQTTGGNGNFFSISFFDMNIGIAIGGGGKRTTDGGVTWMSVPSLSGNLRDIKVFDQNNAIVVGWDGAVFMTSDAGLTWTDHSIAVNRDFFAAGYKTLDSLTIVGEHCVMFHSYDGGSTWQRQYDISNEYLLAIQYSANGSVWVTGDKGVILSSVEPDNVTGIEGFEYAYSTPELLQPNIPNPFSEITTIHFRVPHSENVSLVIHDQLGREVRTLVHDKFPTGEFSVKWDGRDDAGQRAAAGLYICVIRTGAIQQGRQMILLEK